MIRQVVGRQLIVCTNIIMYSFFEKEKEVGRFPFFLFMYLYKVFKIKPLKYSNMATISKDVIYIGVDDAEITLFEGQYDVPEGMCYNSYLINDSKIAIMDTVDERKAEEWKKNLKSALNGRQPDYLVVQHMEPDHSSLIDWVMTEYPATQILCTAVAVKMIPLYYPTCTWMDRVEAVKEGQELNLGTHTLKFIAAPLVHWPEVMMTYDATDKILFAADGFGKFGTIDADADDWACEARRYYFNICGKFGVQVQNVLKKASALDIQTICPLHGPILTGEKMAEAIRLYNIWSQYEVETPGVFIAYASMHGNTEKAVQILAEELKAQGAPKVTVSNLCTDDMGEAIEDAFRMGALVVACPTYDGDIMPIMHDFIQHLRMKQYQKRRVGFLENGSWAPQAARIMYTLFQQMKEIELVEEKVTIRGAVKESDLPAIKELAHDMVNLYQ